MVQPERLQRRGLVAFNARLVHAATLVFEAALIGGVATYALSQKRYLMALVIVALPLVWRVVYAGTLTLVSRFMFATPEATPLFSRAWLSLVATGGVAIARNQVAMAFPPRLPVLPKAGLSPIVALIPGYSCNAGCFGTLPQKFGARGLECLVFDTANPIGDLAANASEAAAWLNAIAHAASDRPIILVGVSMGGIVARLATVHSDRPRIAHLVTISAPHHGTWMARFGIGLAARQMRLDSEMLRHLRSQPLTSPATAIWTPDDAIILPPDSGKLAGARMIAVAGYTHLAIVEAPAVEAAILAAAAHFGID